MHKDIKAIYERERRDIFSMATTHLMDIGYRKATEITDEEIEELDGNGLMTKEFVQYLVRLTRELAKASTPVELIIFCQVVELYDVSTYKIPWNRMSEIATNAIWALHENGGDWEYELEELDLDNTERKYFGVPLEEEDGDGLE
jgi:hypothetical protein